jgi:alpha-1,2-mannosyltransferase
MRRLTPWLAGLVVVGAVYAVLSSLWVASRPASLGFDILLVRSASERLRNGEPIYLDPGGANFIDPSPADFYGPPALAVAGLPLTLVPAEIVRLGSFPVSWLVFGLGLLVLSRQVHLTRDQLAAVFIGAMLAFAVAWGATLGASSVWLFGLLAGAAVALDRRSDLAAGVLIGTAAALRIYPVVLLLPLMVAGRWRAVVGALGVILGWSLIGIVVAGAQATQTFVTLLGSLGGADAGSSSIALTGAGRAASVIAGAALLLWAGWLDRRAAAAPERLLGWGLAFGGMLLVTPVVWDHYPTALLPLVIAVAATTGVVAAGLLSVGMLPAWLAGGYVIVWLPLIGVIAALRARRRAVR